MTELMGTVYVLPVVWIDSEVGLEERDLYLIPPFRQLLIYVHAYLPGRWTSLTAKLNNYDVLLLTSICPRDSILSNLNCLPRVALASSAQPLVDGRQEPSPVCSDDGRFTSRAHMPRASLGCDAVLDSSPPNVQQSCETRANSRVVSQ